ncbi:hypothetical protein TFKS16_0813 [Tannerella forsythia KS16]|nr:hypothetical protein TFKS16_0813 [Tannerella forsythia KS16]
MPVHHVGANLVFAFFFVLCRGVRTQMTQMTRINANNCVCPWPRAVSRRSSEQQGERKSGCPKRSELPDFPTCERRDDVRSARSLDLLVTFGSSQK